MKKTVIGIIFLLTCASPLTAAVRFTNNDPYPVYTSANPLGPFTYWEDCKPEQSFLFSVSFFRQNADKGRRSPFDTTPCDPNNSCANCAKVCNQDVELGDIHGPWAMLALFYPEANGNCVVGNNLIAQLGLLTFPNAVTCLAALLDPHNADSQQERFGYFAVPVHYRKYGLRIEADIGTCWDIGLRIQTGLATIRQNADFHDFTCSTTGDACGPPGCVINSFSCDCTTLVVKGIMEQRNIVAETLGLDIRDFCETDIEDITVGLYWSHCYEVNKDTKNPCWPRYTFAPYFIAEVSVPLSNLENLNKLFALPFGTDRHWGVGFTGGFNFNFVETIQLGLEAGFMHFSKEFYAAHPVPTSDLQQSIFPRKADLCIRPGQTWTFGATLGASYFISCLSFYGQFRLIHHCNDCINIINTIPVPVLAPTTACPTDNFVASNIKLEKMKKESAWDSSFFNVYFDYDISENVALGFFWQAPITQLFAYRPTTVMASAMVKF